MHAPVAFAPGGRDDIHECLRWTDSALFSLSIVLTFATANTPSFIPFAHLRAPIPHFPRAVVVNDSQLPPLAKDLKPWYIDRALNPDEEVGLIRGDCAFVDL
ncbi:hypothetical protein C8R43DRAFT_1126364 [Mycena crocata]|nr:hypothetical protein C8R43DRAFT_1126364 [Mycena crocata]